MNVKTKVPFRKIVSILFLIAIVGIAIIYYKGHIDDIQLIRSVSIEAILIIPALVFINFLFNGLQLKVLTDHYRLNLTFIQWFGLSRLSGFTYLFLPFPSGASLKALYLKKICGFRYSSFIASMAIAKIVRLAVFSFFSLLFLLRLGAHNVYLSVITGIVFSGTMTFLLFGYNIRLPYLSSSNSGYIS